MRSSPGRASPREQTRPNPPRPGLEAHFERPPSRTPASSTAATCCGSAGTLYVGRSTRTDAAGIARCWQSRRTARLDVVQAELRDCLHLKTGATFAGPDIDGMPVLLYNARCGRPAPVRRRRAAARSMTANRPPPIACASVRRLILPAGNPRTAEPAAATADSSVAEVDVSELQKAEAGVTCMSLIDEALGEQRLGLVQHLAEAVDDQPVRLRASPYRARPS